MDSCNPQIGHPNTRGSLVLSVALLGGFLDGEYPENRNPVARYYLLAEGPKCFMYILILE